MKRMYSVLLAIFLSSCTTPAAPPSTFTASPTKTPAITHTPLATVTAVCISPEPTEEDLDAALAYTDDVFDPAEWEQSHSMGEESLSVTWQNIPQSAVVFLEAIIFPCGYEEP